MRETKFRAWDGERMMSVEALYFGKDGNISMPHFTMNGGVLMQFTGLRDKNGKEIYEGDIVKVVKADEGHEGYEGMEGAVEWCSKCCAGYRLQFLGIGNSERISSFSELEVVRNIYEDGGIINQPESR